jgi:NDP-sugar pyrophosphorylase family protein
MLLAGGLGTRLLPYTTVLPKPLVPVGDSPVMENLLRQLAAHDVCDVTVSVGHLAGLIEAYFGNGSRFGVRITYQHETEPLGTAGPLRNLADWTADDAVLVVNGDLLTDLDFSSFIAAYELHRPAIQVGIVRREERIELGVLTVGEDGRVHAYEEKPLHVYDASMGVYILSGRVKAVIPDTGRFDMPRLVLGALDAGHEVRAWRHDGIWLDIGRPDDHRRAAELVSDNPNVFKRNAGAP